MKVFLVALMVLSGTFLCLNLANAGDNDIIISEIGAYESSNNEWIEVYNRGSDPVDITGWKFFENDTNHGLSLYQGVDIIIEPHEYAIIADVAENFASNWPSFSGTIIDSSWSTLNENGESIELRTSSDPSSVVESFTYISAGDYSLERIDLNLDDYSSNNWKEHQNSGTPGQQNSDSTNGSQNNDTNSNSDTPPANTNQNNSRPRYDPSAVVINELMIDPQNDQDEWLELYNNTGRSINLLDWKLEDGSGRVTDISGVIMAHGFLVVGEFNGRLNNIGDQIRLIDSSDRVIDIVAYGNWNDNNIWDNAPTAVGNGSLSRNTDGFDTDNDLEDFSVTKKETMGVSNSFWQIDYDLPEILITELLPNPIGDDSRDEFIEVYNFGDSKIDLTGWWLTDDSNKKYILSGEINSGEYLVFKREDTGIALNNFGQEVVRLYQGDGLLISQVGYDVDVLENYSYSYDNISWQWSETPTEGIKNIITQANQAPVAKIIIDKDYLEVGENLTLDASDSYDMEDIELNYLWDLGDGTTSTESFLEHTYIDMGNYETVLMITDSEGLSATATSTVVVGGVIVNNIEDIQIIISEFLPNPTTEETNGEWIEIANIGSSPVNLNNWILDDIDGGSKPFKIEGATIYPGEYVVFSRSVTGIALNNDSDSVRLINGSGVLVDSVDYSNAGGGLSYSYDFNYGWQWTDSVTPSMANIIGVTSNPNLISNINIPLAEVRSLEIGSQVTVEGVVSVEPGLLGTQIFYLAGSGVQIYCYSKDFPDLSVGDLIRVSGEISEAGGETRIKIKGTDDIEMIVKGGELPIPEEIEIGEIGEDTEGHLVKVSGEVIEKNGNSIYLDDGNEEIKVYIKKSTNIDVKNISEGSKLTVIGIVS